MVHKAGIRLSEFYSACVYASLVHAVSMCESCLLSHEQSWDGSNYSVQDSQGTTGTVSFANGACVGVFFDENSPRSPFRSPGYDISDVLRDVPEEIRQMAEVGALKYVLVDIGDREVPAVTAIFWSHGDEIEAYEPWDDVVRHGAHAVGRQMLGTTKSVTAWEEYLEISPELIQVAADVYKRKMESGDNAVVIMTAETDVLTRLAADDECLSECLTSFAELGIAPPTATAE